MTRIIPVFFAAIVITISILKSPDLPSYEDSTNNYLPSTKYAFFISVDQTETFASLFWISGLISYGGSLITGNQYKWLIKVCDLVTTLDPLMKMPYLFGGTAPGLSKTQDVVNLLYRGTNTFPQDWRLALYYSLAEVDINHNYLKATNRMKEFSESDSVPLYIRKIHRTFEARTKPWKEALMMNLEDYCNPQFAEFRKGLVRRMIENLHIPDADEAKFKFLLNTIKNTPDQRSWAISSIIKEWPQNELRLDSGSNSN